MAAWIICKAGKKAKLQLLAPLGFVTLTLRCKASTCTASPGQNVSAF